MVILQQIALRVRQFHVPKMQTETIEAKTRHMVHVTVDSLLAVHAQSPQRAIGMGKGHGIVCAVIAHLGICARTAHDTLVIHINRASRSGSRRYTGCGQQSRRKQKMSLFHNTTVRLLIRDSAAVWSI